MLRYFVVAPTSFSVNRSIHFAQGISLIHGRKADRLKGRPKKSMCSYVMAMRWPRLSRRSKSLTSTMSTILNVASNFCIIRLFWWMPCGRCHCHIAERWMAFDRRMRSRGLMRNYDKIMTKEIACKIVLWSEQSPHSRTPITHTQRLNWLLCRHHILTRWWPQTLQRQWKIRCSVSVGGNSTKSRALHFDMDLASGDARVCVSVWVRLVSSTVFARLAFADANNAQTRQTSYVQTAKTWQFKDKWRLLPPAKHFSFMFGWSKKKTIIVWPCRSVQCAPGAHRCEKHRLNCNLNTKRTEEEEDEESSLFRYIVGSDRAEQVRKREMQW